MQVAPAHPHAASDAPVAPCRCLLRSPAAYAGLVDLMYSNDIASWVRSVRFLLERYPGFLFSKNFYDISTLSSATIDTQEGKLVQGPGFFW